MRSSVSKCLLWRREHLRSSLVFQMVLQWHIQIIAKHFVFASHCKSVANGHRRRKIYLKHCKSDYFTIQTILRLWNCSTISKLNMGIKYLLNYKESLLPLTKQSSLCYFFLFSFSCFFSPWVPLAYFGLVSEWIEEVHWRKCELLHLFQCCLAKPGQKRHSLLHFQKQIIGFSNNI